MEFFGSLPNSKLPPHYSEAAISVFPFRKSQGFGLVLVEALGCESVVISGDVPAIHDIITDNQNGIIIDANQTQALAEKIIWLLKNPEKAKVLATKGRNEAINKFDWESVHIRYTKLISSLIAE